MFNTEDLFVVEDPAWHVDPTGSSITCVDYSPNGALIAYSNQPGKIFVASSYEGIVKRTLDQKMEQFYYLIYLEAKLLIDNVI